MLLEHSAHDVHGNEQYGLDELKTKAFDDIESKLTSDNIMLELFSTITSM